MPEITIYPPGSVAWVDVTVPDLEAGKAFYGGVFGWTFRAPPDAGGYVSCETSAGRSAGMRVVLENESPTWNTFLTVDNADTTAEVVTRSGGSIVYSPMTTFGEERVLAARDPMGAGVWFIQREPASWNLVSGGEGTVCWNELHAPQPEQADAFYGSLFGYDMQPEGAPEFDYMIYRVKGDERMVGGRFGTSGATPPEPAFWQVYFETDDPDGAVQRVVELGGTVVDPLEDSPYGRMGTVRDPFGALFAVMRPAPTQT